LSSSNQYDWFSGNPRFNLKEVKAIIKGFKCIRVYEDNATISITLKI